MSGLGDLQACPWCAFVGTPALFDMHMETHEQSPTVALVGDLVEAKAEIKRLKAQLKERQKDYAKTLGEMAAKNATLAAELAKANWVLEGLRK